MVVVVVCSVLAALSLLLMVALRREQVTAPHTAVMTPAGRPAAPAAGQPRGARAARVRAVLHRYLWWATVATVAGMATGILWTGPVARLAMRALALTSPDAAGRITEANEEVGAVSVSGTIALLVFAVLPDSFLSAVVYALIHRWLPRGLPGGLLFGGVLLVVAAPLIDPLRAENRDFDILQPGWLAVLLFTVMILGHGMLLAAITGWYSARLPVQPARPWLAFSPLIAAVLYLPAAFLVLIGGVLTAIGAALVPGIGRWWASRPATWSGRIALTLLVALSLPGFIAAVVSIATG